MNERTTQRKKETVSSLPSNLGFQLSTVSNSMNGFGARLANSVWDEMVFENQLFHVTKYSTINEILRIQGLLYTANLKYHDDPGDYADGHGLCGIAAPFPSNTTRPSCRKLRGP